MFILMLGRPGASAPSSSKTQSTLHIVPQTEQDASGLNEIVKDLNPIPLTSLLTCMAIF